MSSYGIGARTLLNMQHGWLSRPNLRHNHTLTAVSSFCKGYTYACFFFLSIRGGLELWSQLALGHSKRQSLVVQPNSSTCHRTISYT
jgi:hypothetical protein